jgi:hypothetical protein
MRRVLATLVWMLALAVLTPPGLAQQIRGQGEVYFQPVGVPIEISLSADGTLNVSSTNEIATPFGVFGIGGGVAAAPRDRGITCFIIRRPRHNSEATYCIGESGRLRLTTVGRSIVEISAAPGKSNTYILDVLREIGRFEVTFIPAPGDGILVQIPFLSSGGPTIDVNGTVSSFVTTPAISTDRIRQISIRRITYRRGLDSYRQWLTTIVYLDASGRIKQSSVPADRSRELEVRWLMHVLRRQMPEKLLVPESAFLGARIPMGIVVYEDGSLCLEVCSYGPIVGEAIERVVPSPSSLAGAILHIRPEYLAAYPRLRGGHPIDFPTAKDQSQFLAAYNSVRSRGANQRRK